MAGSTGIVKWQKYFQQDLSTFMKKDSVLYHPDNKPTGKIIPKLATITYKMEPEYCARCLIVWNNDVYRVSFDDVGKPNRKGTFTLKPQDDLNIKGEYTLSALLDYSKRLLYESDIYGDDLVNYLYGLILHAESPNDTRIKEEIRKMYSMWKSTLPINTINNDFGELLGAIYLFKHDPKFKSAKKILFPTIGNEPLMDYKFLGPSGDFVISAKSSASKTSNVVKPKGVLELLVKSGKDKKWKNSVAWDVVNILNDESMLTGPVIVVSKYKKTVPEFRSVDLSNRYQCEKAIEQFTKRDESFKKMFLDAIGANVYYAYFKIATDGLPEIKCEPDNMMKKEIFIRTKNSINSCSDKMGFQP